MKLFSLFLILYLFTNPSFSQSTINIPSDYPTIQEGIAAASDGDIVLVADGTYIENINFNGKGITVASHFLIDGNKSHIENTIIDGSQPTIPNLASVVSIWSGEDSTSILCGFTITGGIGSGWSSYERAGGGIYIYNSSPVIKNNIIQNNHTIAAGHVGGSAILVDPRISKTTIIENNIIKNNIAQSTGSNTWINGTILVHATSSTLIIRNNIISDNTLLPEPDNLYCNGGGISAFGYDLPGFLCIIENNIIQNNTVNPEGQNPIAGGLHLNAINAVVRNNIIAFNSAKRYGGIHYANTYANNVRPEIVNNLIIGNVATSTCGGISTHYPYVIQNCIIWGNSSPQYYGTIATIDYSNLEESYSNGSHNISLNPEFLDTIYYFLSDTSPCIDMGNPDPMYNDIEDPTNSGFALYPAQGTLINDIGHFGGPHSNWANLISDTLYVPDDYATIQEAIDAAVDGNTILVADGTYYENINYKGKAITVASHFLVDGDSTHIENTIIDGSQPANPDSGSVVSFFNGEDTTSVLCGFTITGGTGTRDTEYPNWVRSGGGIFTDSAGAKIINNIIMGNSIVQDPPETYDLGGGGILVNSVNNNIIIRDNVIKENYAQGYYTFGAAIALWSEAYSLVENNIIINNIHNSSLTQGGGIHTGIGDHHIVNNLFAYNSAISKSSNTGGGGGAIFTISPGSMDFSPFIANNLIVQNEGTQGGGIKIYTSSATLGKGVTKNTAEIFIRQDGMTFNPIIENNTIIFNTAPGAGGGIRSYYTPAEIRNNIIWGNDGAANLDQISGTGNEIVTYCNVQGGYGGGTGNIDEDPMFDDTTYYCINQNSPCVDAGNPDPIYNDLEDPMNPGYPRLPARGTLTNDMGCFGGQNSLWCNWDILVSVENDGSEEGVPNEFTLSQNYPNPFNPATTIKYAIPERAIVELKVYDILGNEVASLINEEQEAGNYELNFNAANLSSGVYFYQLSAGKFIETKKMLLVK